MNIVDKIRNQIVRRNPFIIFLPFLMLSVLLVITFKHSVLLGDEGKYLNYANNLLKGYYSPPPPNIYLSVGPGYPLLIVPFLWMKLPLISITLLNAILFYFSIILLYKTLQFIVNDRIALSIGLFWALYYNVYENFLFISPETLAPFLITCFSYFLVKSFNSKGFFLNKYIYYAGFTFGYIALSKIIFGYVILFMLVGNGLLLLLNRKSVNFRKSMIVLIIAITTTFPYLLYTYNLTGRVFYWGSSGGNNMYWMSTPNEKEYGNWYADPGIGIDTNTKIKNNIDFRHEEYKKIISKNKDIPGVYDYLWYNHQKDFDEINKFSGVEQDDIYKKIAIQNIKSHPTKYIMNIFSNLGRILFNYPYSYKLEKPETLLRLPLNGIILVLMLFSLFSTILNWRKILFPVRFLLFVFILYIGGSLTGSAESRMFNVIVPILLIWIAFIIERTVTINWRFRKNE